MKIRNLYSKFRQVRSSVLLSLATIALTSKEADGQQVSTRYVFSQSSGTYTPITNGTTIDSAYECSSSNRILDTDGRWVTLPFTFDYNNNLVDSVFVNNDGAVVFGYNATGGATFTSTNSNILGVLTPMNRDLWGVHVTQVSTTSGSNVLSNVNSFVGMDIGKCIYGTSSNIPYGTTITAIDQTNNTITTSANAGATNASLQLRIASGKILSKVEGTAPNRTFTIEWRDWADYATSGNPSSVLNFQVKLYETSNKIEFVYGNCSQSYTTTRTSYVGIRGANINDFLGRTSTTSWTATTPSTAIGNTVTRTDAINPPSGLTFTYTVANCVGFNGIARNITEQAATIKWTNTGTVLNNQVYYSTSNTAPTNPTANTLFTSNDSINLTALQANTKYYYYTRRICSATDTSAWSLIDSFKTECAPVATWNENFDSYSASTTLPDCWNRLVPGSGTLSISSTTPASGTRNLYLYSTSAANMVCAVLPPFNNVNAGTHWLKFKVRSSSSTSAARPILGYVTNPNDINSFVAIDTLNITNNTYSNSTTWEPSTAIPANARLAIKNGNINSTGIYFDDMSWELKPNCLPIVGTTSNVEATEATIHWTNPSAVLNNQVYFNTTNTAPTNNQTANSVFSTIDSVVLTNLTPNTTYYYYVRQICNATDTSAWSYVDSFKTACAPVATWNEDFDTYGTGNTLPSCWFRLVPGSGSLTISSSSPASGTRNLYLYSSSVANTVCAVLPTFSNVNLGTHWLKFKVRSSSATTAATPILGYVTNPNDINSFVAIDTLSITNTTYTNTFTYFDPGTSIPANAILAIKNAGINTTSIYFDDFSWEAKPSCVQPTATAATIIDQTNVVINWNNVVPAPTHYEYYLSTSNTVPTATTVATDTALGNSKSLTNLTPDTRYYFWVRSICSSTNQSTWTTTDSFYTGYCIAPYTSTTTTPTHFDTIVTTGGIHNINRTATGFATNGYANYAATDSLVVYPNNPTISNTVYIVSGSAGVSVFVDWNNDLVFDASERIFTSSAYKSNQYTFTYDIPATAQAGKYRMRYVTDYNSTTPSACSYGSGRGETEDYSLVVKCDTVSPISLGNDIVNCNNAPITLAPTTIPTGGTYLWSDNSTTSSISVNNTGTYWLRYTTASGCQYSDTINVSTGVAPTLNLGNDTSICGSNTLTLNAGNPGATYLWNDNSSAQTLVVTQSGTYSVTVTNAAGCQVSDTILVTQLPTPDLSNIVDEYIVCNNAPITMSTPTITGATYNWKLNGTTVSTNATYTTTTSGIYVLTVTNTNGCFDTATITVGQGTTPVVNLGNDTTICSGNTLTLNATNTGATYLWNDNSTAATLAVTQAGTYWVRVTSSTGCEKTDTIVVNTVNSPVNNLNASYDICPGNSILLNAGNAGATYVWKQNNTTIGTAQTITLNTVGNYSLTVTNANGCASTFNFVVNPGATPSVNLGNDTAICSSETLVLSALNPGATYLWSNGATSNTINAQQAGTYWVQVTNAQNCVGTDTIVVSTLAAPTPALNINTYICNNGTTVLDAQNPGATYQWILPNNGTATTQTVTANVPGYYEVSITNANGCTITDSTFVSIATTPNVNLGNDTAFCVGNALVLNPNVANAASYAWNTGATTNTITVTQSGTYAVTVSDPTGTCFGADTIHITVNEIPTIDSIDFNILANRNVNFSVVNPLHASTYVWDFGDGNMGSGLSPIHQYTADGNFVVKVILMGPCGTDTFQTIVNIVTNTSVGDVNKDTRITLYPNPANEYFTIKADKGVQVQQVIIYNAVGQEMKKVINLDQSNLNITTDQLASGFYNVRIITNQGQIDKKLNIIK